MIHNYRSFNISLSGAVGHRGFMDLTTAMCFYGALSLCSFFELGDWDV